MKSNFSAEDKRNFLFIKHIKNHWFEYVLDLIMPVLLTVFMLYLCKAENFGLGIGVALIYSVVRVVYHLYHFKKEFIDLDNKEEPNEKHK